MRAEARKSASARRGEDDAQRNARRAAEAGEAEVHRLEGAIGALEEQVADPALYDGGGEGARKAGQLDRELKSLRAELDRALARWTDAVDALERPNRQAPVRSE